MATYLITYDLIGPNRDYTAVIDWIKGYGTYAPITESCWAIETAKSASTVRDEGRAVIDDNDVLVVFTLQSGTAWRNLPNDVGAWIKRRFS
jgi:hypothetical protein